MVDLKLIKPEHLWYIIGLIATDGNLSKDKRHIDITSKHRDYLIDVQKALGISGKIGTKSSGSSENRYPRLQFSDVAFYKFLLGIGLTPNKSLTMGVLSIDDNYFDDFLRGVIDGDGSISTWIHNTNRHRQWSLRVVSAAPVFSNWLKNEIEGRYNVRGRIYNHKYKDKSNFINIIKFGKLAAKRILQQIYYKGALSLKRKDISHWKCLQDKDKMINYGGVLK